MRQQMPDTREQECAEEVRTWYEGLLADLEAAEQEHHDAWIAFREKQHEALVFAAVTENNKLVFSWEQSLAQGRAANPALFLAVDALHVAWDGAQNRYLALKRQWDFALVWLRRARDPD